MSQDEVKPVLLLYPGDRAMRDRADPSESRFAALFSAFAAAGVTAAPAVYHDDFADEVAAQLMSAALVLVWCNPIEGGRRRDRLDALLRQTAASGVIVSSHPDTIDRLGTKDVLFETRDLPFGSDVQRVDSLAQLAAELPARLAQGPRVLKQQRGHSGIGVWRVERRATADDGTAAPCLLAVREARRGSDDQRLDLATLLARLAPCFEPAQGGHLIDQAWMPRLQEGMVRAYLVADRVVGFGLQAVNALLPALPGQPAPQPGPRLYHPPELPAQQALRQALETGWITLLCQRLGLSRAQLPLLWDIDFLHGERAPGAPERWVLCEINVSSVSPFPPSAVAPLVAAVQARLQSGRPPPG